MPPANNRRNNRRAKHVPVFARNHPFLYKLFLFSAQFTTPLTFLTIASTSGILHRNLPTATPSPSASWSPYLSRSFVKSRFPVTPAGTSASLSLAIFSKWRWNWPVDWRRMSVWLWYLSVWSYIARYALIGTSVFWVLSGWEEEGDAIERENAAGEAEENREGQAA